MRTEFRQALGLHFIDNIPKQYSNRQEFIASCFYDKGDQKQYSSRLKNGGANNTAYERIWRLILRNQLTLPEHADRQRLQEYIDGADWNLTSLDEKICEILRNAYAAGSIQHEELARVVSPSRLGEIVEQNHEQNGERNAVAEPDESIGEIEVDQSDITHDMPRDAAETGLDPENIEGAAILTSIVSPGISRFWYFAVVIATLPLLITTVRALSGDFPYDRVLWQLHRDFLFSAIVISGWKIADSVVMILIIDRRSMRTVHNLFVSCFLISLLFTVIFVAQFASMVFPTDVSLSMERSWLMIAPTIALMTGEGVSSMMLRRRLTIA